MSKRQPDQEGGRPDQARGPGERQFHGGMPQKPDDEQLARRAEAERVENGVDAYDPEDVPAAAPPSEGTPTGRTPGTEDVRRSGQYESERAEVDRELARGELDPDQLQARKDRRNFPPTRYDE
ncbi:DEAD/DEAH box helicase [Streptomyces sp. NHF165]|uniref:DEAD/DEAH box helicase n=1 Tax=Streptomyces sp. NHF165 TaxID=2175864 RepID=UPI001F2211E9|nr:DEAD/DEAH box helicase [Streptomyces sp. NHF165]